MIWGHLWDGFLVFLALEIHSLLEPAPVTGYYISHGQWLKTTLLFHEFFVRDVHQTQDSDMANQKNKPIITTTEM